MMPAGHPGDGDQGNHASPGAGEVVVDRQQYAEAQCQHPDQSGRQRPPGDRGQRGAKREHGKETDIGTSQDVDDGNGDDDSEGQSRQEKVMRITRRGRCPPCRRLPRTDRVPADHPVHLSTPRAAPRRALASSPRSAARRLPLLTSALPGRFGGGYRHPGRVLIDRITVRRKWYRDHATSRNPGILPRLPRPFTGVAKAILALQEASSCAAFSPRVPRLRAARVRAGVRGPRACRRRKATATATGKAATGSRCTRSRRPCLPGIGACGVRFAAASTARAGASAALLCAAARGRERRRRARCGRRQGRPFHHGVRDGLLVPGDGRGLREVPCGRLAGKAEKRFVQSSQNSLSRTRRGRLLDLSG